MEKRTALFYKSIYVSIQDGETSISTVDKMLYFRLLKQHCAKLTIYQLIVYNINKKEKSHIWNLYIIYVQS